MDESPVIVEAVLKTGHKLSFKAFGFKSTAEGYEFTDFPEQRGHKILQLLSRDSLASIRIQAPDQYFENWRQTSPTVPVAVASSMGQILEDPTVPQRYRSAGARAKDQLANESRAIAHPAGLPMSEIVGENGERSVVNAAMIQG